MQKDPVKFAPLILGMLLSVLVFAQDSSQVYLKMDLGKKFVYSDSTQAIEPGMPDNSEFWDVFGGPLRTDSLWKHEGTYDQLQIYTRPWPESDFDAAKSIDTIHTPINQIVATLYDYTAYTQWINKEMDFLEIVEWDKEAQYVITHFGVNMPWPITDRDVVMVTHYYQDLNSNNINFYSRTLNGVVPSRNGYFRIENSMARGTLIPLDDTTTLVITEGHGDPGGHIPPWLVNYFLEDVTTQTSEDFKRHNAQRKYVNMDVPWLN